MAQPTKKQCVEVLMRYFREERRTVVNDTTSPRMNVSYAVYERPECNFCRNPNGPVSFQKNRGFTNSFNHLLNCYKRKKDLFTVVRRLIATQTDIKVRPSLQDVFDKTGSNREKALHSYIQLIIFCNAPVSRVENKHFRQFSNFVARFTSVAARRPADPRVEAQRVACLRPPMSGRQATAQVSR